MIEKQNKALESFSESKEEQTIEAIDFSSLERGDRLIIQTSSNEFEITVIGKRKDGLRVEVKQINQRNEKVFTARLPGGFTMHGPGLTAGTIKIENKEEKNCLYFENIVYYEKGQKMNAPSMRTTPISEIIHLKKEK